MHNVTYSYLLDFSPQELRGHRISAEHQKSMEFNRSDNVICIQIITSLIAHIAMMTSAAERLSQPATIDNFNNDESNKAAVTMSHVNETSISFLGCKLG